MRRHCEACDKDLAASQNDAYICSYECTFCFECARNAYQFMCPNCGGNLVVRPTRQVS